MSLSVFAEIRHFSVVMLDRVKRIRPSSGLNRSYNDYNGWPNCVRIPQ